MRVMLKRIYRNNTYSTFVLNVCFFLLLLCFLNSTTPAQIIKNVKSISDSTKKIIEKKDSTLTKQAKLSIRTMKSMSMIPKELSEFRVKKSYMVAQDYNFTGDFLSFSPFTFQKKLGYTGLSTETMIYGRGYGSAAFLNDGLELNNRLFNTYNLISFQSESIDSIDVIPLSRSFLFGNPADVSINFIPREPSISKPFSRIRYYQAPNDEGFIDGIFSINPFKKTNVYFEITNNSNGLRYKNSDYTSWSGDARVNYYLSNEINLKFGYKHVTSTVQLNGGVDIDSIASSDVLTAVKDVIYDNITAPVRFYNRYSTSILDNIYISAKMLLLHNAPSEMTIYTNNFNSEYRQNVSGTIQNGVPPVSRDNISKTSGIKLKQDFRDSYFSLNASTFFEHSIFHIDQHTLLQKKDSLQILNLDNKKQNTFAIALLSSAKLIDSCLIPSLFSKYFLQDGNNYFGIGGDIIFLINDRIKIYGGLSQFEKPFSAYVNSMINSKEIVNKQLIKNFELRFLYKNNFFDLSLGYFYNSNDNQPIFAFDKQSHKNDEAYFLAVKTTELNGLNFSFESRLWKLSIATNCNYYFSENSRIENGLPDFTFTGGTYYIDTLFNSNLKLKAGINIYGYGSRYQQQIDFERNILTPFTFDSQNPLSKNYLSLFNNNAFSPSFQFDLFVAGKIQENATIYFTWENLFDAKYSIIPNYPMPSRGIRFGFSWEFFD